MRKIIYIPYKIIKWIVEAVYEAGKWLLVKTNRLIKKIIKLTLKYVGLTIITLGVSFILVIGIWKIWDHNLTKQKEQINSALAPKPLYDIYMNIVRVTEVSNRVPPLRMWADPESFFEVNAFTTGEDIYFSYAAEAVLNTDEKALIMGHEIAHVILHHTDNAFDMFISSSSNENELMADNLGASWAHKAGYDVCKGRKVFMKFYLMGGNSLNESHPPNTLRYENLEHYCKYLGAK